jgi:hypothetical protein
MSVSIWNQIFEEYRQGACFPDIAPGSVIEFKASMPPPQYALPGL